MTPKGLLLSILSIKLLTVYCASAERLGSHTGSSGNLRQITGRQASLSCAHCGIANVGKIIGGDEATIGEFPWMVQLFSNNSFFCAGTLIGHNYVLTAAHCFTKPRTFLKVVLGGHNLSAKSGIMEQNVATVTVHPEFNPELSKGNDIAILKLEDSINFDRKIRAICLPQMDQHFIGMRGVVTGWGRTSLHGQNSDKLNKLSLPIVSRKECKENWFGELLPAGTICAGYVNGRIDSCVGDSGGPLAVKSNGVWYQIGIVSYGASGSCALSYGVYSRITFFLDWIAANVNEDKCFV